MRKIIVLEHISLDGVIQGPGGPEEDRSGGFAYSTPRRARFTGSLLVAIVLFAAAAKILGK